MILRRYWKIYKGVVNEKYRHAEFEKGALDFYLKAQEKVRDKKDFYKRVAGLVGDSEARNMLHELAGEERNHINALLL